MIITTSKIKALEPCEDSFNNFTKHYPDYNSDLINFLNLEDITYSDKVWVFVRLATHVQKVRWSILCAESVLQNFESMCPNDDRPRKAIEAAEAVAINPSEENRQAAYSAANAAYSAANSAYSAAYSAAHSATYSTANAAANAVYSAFSAAADSAAAEKAQEELNLLFMVEACRET